jgi:uncharacterized phage protein gp47/JayE
VASPDLRSYVDLTLDDRTPQELFDEAIAAAATKLPGWNPREGHTAVVLIEALALVIWELIATLNRVPGAVADILFQLYGVTRDTGTAPAVDVTFTLSDTAGHTVPAGTRLRLTLGNGETVEFATDASLIVAAGASSGTVASTGETPTTEANGTAAGTAITVLDAIAFVESAATASEVAGGTDPETTDEWRDRASQVLARLVNTLVLPGHFTAAVLEDTRVYRATSVDNYDPGQVGNPGDHPGHLTTYVLGSDGALLTAAIKDELFGVLDPKALANLAIHVADPTITPVDVTVTVVHKAGHDPATVEQAVTDALTAYLNPETWPWAATVRRNELIALIDGVTGVDYVDTLDAPAGDVALPGVANLADAGTLTITVNAPA